MREVGLRPGGGCRLLLSSRVPGGDYGAVRCAAFMGHRILGEAAGLPPSVGDAAKGLDDSR